MAAFGAWYMGRATTQGTTAIADAYARAGGTASETLSEVQPPSPFGSPPAVLLNQKRLPFASCARGRFF